MTAPLPEMHLTFFDRYPPIPGYNSSYFPGVSEVERWFDSRARVPMDRWLVYSGGWVSGFVAAAVYLALVFLLPRALRRWTTDPVSGKPGRVFELRGALICWNVLLAVFSSLGFLRTLPEMADLAMGDGGLLSTMCSRRYVHGDTAFWGYAFSISKVPEFVDTAFIILRGKRLIFLHWFHHVLTQLVAWYALMAVSGHHRWYMVMNYGVHGVMYTYYALSACRLRLPRAINVCITTMQIAQMFAGFAATLYPLIITNLHPPTPCQVNQVALVVGTLMYAFYIVLFIRFFYSTYLQRSPPAKRGPQSDTKVLDPISRPSQNLAATVAAESEISVRKEGLRHRIHVDSENQFKSR